MDNDKSRSESSTKVEVVHIRDLFIENKFKLDSYQRNFQWGKKQVLEFTTDLTSAFLQDYNLGDLREDISNYSSYFLGSIILENKIDDTCVIDGQQRITTMILLLLFLQKFQNDESQADKFSFEGIIDFKQTISDLFNLSSDECESFLHAVQNNEPFEQDEKPQVIATLYERFIDIQKNWPGELTRQNLPSFCDWLMDKVRFVEIRTSTEYDAYAIFNTMNNRGLLLKQPDLLKSFLLSEIEDSKRTSPAKKWKELTTELNEIEEGLDAQCIKAWLHSQYADSIATGRSARPEDFERIDTVCHSWLQDSQKRIHLNGSDGCIQLIENEFDFFAKNFIKIFKASKKLTEGMEHVHYISQLSLSNYIMILLSPLNSKDSQNLCQQKMEMTAKFLENFVVRRIWQGESITNKDFLVNLFEIMKEIRGKGLSQLAPVFKSKLKNTAYQFDQKDSYFKMNGCNRNIKHKILARLTEFVERESGLDSIYEKLVRTEGDAKNNFEVEHIWHNDSNAYKGQLTSEAKFSDFRNCLGALILLPKSVNSSLRDLKYDKKLRDYYEKSDNMLASSLHSSCYEKKPMRDLIENTGLNFTSYSKFGCAEIQERFRLYCKIAEKIWDPEQFIS